MAAKPDNEMPVGSYPDHPRSGTTRSEKKPGGTHHTGGTCRTKSSPAFPIRIAHIETVPMTPEEFDNAIEAWAILINRYWQQHPEDAT